MTAVVSHSPGRTLPRAAAALLLSLALLAPASAARAATPTQKCPPHTSACASKAPAKGGIVPVTKSSQPTADSRQPTGPKLSPVVTKTEGPSLWSRITSFMLTWLPLIFMGLITVLIGLSLRYIPRTKPQEIKPDTGDSVRWGDV